ncbi:MAG: UbiA prenyltransferase family protein [Dehalococcoidia bacterium]|nr:UbiA prenyltransferase family protein [Dehalococcoidia bacterium]
MTKYLQLARITAWPAYSLTFVISFAVGSYVGTSWTSAWIGFLALFSFAGFAFALNFYSDRDTDRYHDGIQKDFDLRRQPMVTGKVTERECKVFCWAALLIAIVLGFLVSSIFGLLVILACFAGGILYSHPKIRLKAKPIGDIICISLLGVLIPSAGYVLGADILPTPLIMLLWFLVTATGYTASVVSDYEFDLKAGLRTSAVFFGPVKALKLMVVGCLLSIVVAFFIFDASHLYPIGTRYFMVFIVAGLIFLTALLWRSLRSPRMRLTVLSSRKRWVFMAPGAASLAFLCYAFFKIFGIIHLPGDPFGVL